MEILYISLSSQTEWLNALNTNDAWVNMHGGTIKVKGIDFVYIGDIGSQ